jgi:hypothetical protein
MCVTYWSDCGLRTEAHNMQYVVVKLVEALSYKLVGHGYNSYQGCWYFSLAYSSWLFCDSGMNLASNRVSSSGISWGKGIRSVGLATLSSFADCLELWEPQPPGALRTCQGL